jgi:mannose-6-phosphate isomerase-like protein (cupin superfamily)
MTGEPVPYKVEKPWGHELIWARTDRYVGKVLHVKAGHALSCQYHNVKDETLHVLQGELLLRLGQGKDLREIRFGSGQSIRITPGTVHELEAISDVDVLEASTPELDDVVRLKDRYGRA